MSSYMYIILHLVLAVPNQVHLYHYDENATTSGVTKLTLTPTHIIDLIFISLSNSGPINVYSFIWSTNA